MMSGTLIDRFNDGIRSFQGSILSLVIIPQCSHKDLAKRQSYTLKIWFQLLRKKQLLFISPSAAAMFICRDKAIVSHKQRTFIEMPFSNISSQAAQL